MSDNTLTPTAEGYDSHDEIDSNDGIGGRRGQIAKVLSRQTYSGSLIFNIGAFLLPALYGTLSKLWVANIDSSQVVTTDVYGYIGVVIEVLNGGLPRAAWLVIGDSSTRSVHSRIELAYTLIMFQILFGAILTIAFVAGSEQLADTFIPAPVRDASLTYVRISSIQALSSAMETAVACSTRALDHPDVPLLISSTKFTVNIIFDFLIISKFHVGVFAPTVNTQAMLRMVCDLTSAVCGLIYFLSIALRMLQSNESPETRHARPSIACLKILARPGIYTFIECALRNSIYLWFISGLVSISSDYATAWGVFNGIRWVVIDVPVLALEATALTFVGHQWATWRYRTGAEMRMPHATKQDLIQITKPAFTACILALAIEIPICLFFSFWGVKSFAFYLSKSDSVAEITQMMWKSLDWCFILYAVSTQLAAVLLATTPTWYLVQAVTSNLLWLLPWAVVVSRVGLTPDNAWSYHSVIFGGTPVFDLLSVLLVGGVWAWVLSRAKMTLQPVIKEL